MPPRTLVKLRLYVAGNAQNSALATANLNALCREHLKGRHQIDVTDVFRDPQSALANGIFMTPTLVKVAPSPARRIVGTLGDAQLVLQTLELREK